MKFKTNKAISSINIIGKTFEVDEYGVLDASLEFQDELYVFGFEVFNESLEIKEEKKEVEPTKKTRVKK